jgi:hypothetical protein
MTIQQKNDLEEAMNGAREIESDFEVLRELFVARDEKWERIFRHIGEIVLQYRYGNFAPHIFVWTGFEMLIGHK